jgi:hypothetical protein
VEKKTQMLEKKWKKEREDADKEVRGAEPM